MDTVATARTYRIGIIGYGNRGRSHAQTLEALGERAELVAVADPAGVEEGGRVKTFSEYRKLLELPIDAVVIATPEVAHVDVALDALDAGKAVLLEKAAAATWPDAVRLYRGVRSHKGRFMLGFNLRHFPAMRVAKEVLDRGTIGRVVAVSCHVDAGSHWGASCFRRYYHDRDACGDLVLSKLTHDTDATQHMLSTRATRVTGVVADTTFVDRPGAGSRCSECSIAQECTEFIDIAKVRDAHPLADVCPFTRPRTSHDTAILSGQFQNGVVFSFVFTTAGPRYERRYHFNGTEGEVLCVPHGLNGPHVTVHRTDGEPVNLEIPTAEGTHGGGDDHLMRSFLDYLDSGTSPPHEPETILTSVFVPMGGMESAATGIEVNLDQWYREAVAGTA